LTIAAVKRGLVLADRQVGRLVLLPLVSLPAPVTDDGVDEVFLTADLVGPWLPPRVHDLHKGGAGRIALICGSQGMTGAAALAALGALHGGAGLVHVFCPGGVVGEVAARCPPEAMVRELPGHGLAGFPAEDFDVIVLGPGCGRHLDSAMPAFVRRCARPLVLDADALNGLARQCGPAGLPLKNPPAERLVTPHPGEFARLAPDLAEHPRPEAARAFAARFPGTTLLLKGARTIIARSDRALAYNSTGHHGLASGGSGDVLAGLAAALLVRQPDAWRAAGAAAWLHGRSAELTCIHGNESPESLVASTTARWLGQAFRSLARRDA
jgi:NAD(P)H-hydrate epimerase